jgi:hypothetical protein
MRLLCAIALVVVGFVPQASAQVTNPVPGDRPGGDFLGFALSTSDPQLCRIACQRHVRCRAYTFGPAARGTNARCWLKETIPDLVTTPPFQSGTRTGPSIAADPVVNEQPEDFTFEPGTDRLGSDFEHQSLPPGSAPTACAALCRGDARCLAYTFTHRDSVSACHLKDRVPQVSACAFCTSGRKIGNPEVPPSNIAMGNNTQRSVDPVRPLLVVIFDAMPGVRACSPGQIAPTRVGTYHPQQTVDYWRRFFFGPNEPNIARYFHRASGGKLSFVEAGILGPFNIPCLTAGRGQWTYQAALQQAVGAGFDFSRFDRNGDRTVSSDELSVVVIDNLSFGSAQSSPITGPVAGVAINPWTTIIGYQSQFWNFAHELGHHLDMMDVYGALSISRCFGTNLTLASCTATGNVGADRSQQFVSVYPDGYHRMFWGWAQPLIVNMRGRGGCYRLTAVPDRHSNPIIFFDPMRGPLGAARSEYYLVEHRSPSLNEFGDESGAMIQFRDLSGNPFGQAWNYDNDFNGSRTPNAGTLVWWVQIGPAGPAALTWNRPIRIIRGPNNILDSRRTGDDVDLRDGAGQRFAVLPGRNNVIDSTLAVDDLPLLDASPISTANPQATLPAPVPVPNRPAPPPVLLANSPPTQLTWLDGTVAPMTIRAGPVVASGGPTTVELEWGSVPLAIETTSASLVARRGSTLRLSGLFGASNFGGARRVELSGRPPLPSSSVTLAPRFWSCGEMQVDVPASTAAGNYELRIIGTAGEPTATANITVE